MALFTPGQFKQSLKQKIQETADPGATPNAPVTIKNTNPENFSKPASTYAANQMREIKSNIQSPRSTATLPKESLMNKSVHERMQSFVKGQYGSK